MNRDDIPNAMITAYKPSVFSDTDVIQFFIRDNDNAQFYSDRGKFNIKGINSHLYYLKVLI